MDPDSEDQSDTEKTEAWSGSESSQEDSCRVSDMKPESCNSEEDTENLPMNSSSSHVPKPDSEPKECWEMESEEHLSEREENVFYREREVDKSESSPTRDMVLALTLHPGEEEPRGPAGNSQSAGTESPRVHSSEGGGSSDAPTACVSFGISEEGAEQAQRWDSGSDTNLCRPTRHRTRHTRLSQSERHVKETKSKCKSIALLLTHAPNPRNKGVLLFKKRQQRVENFTFISYGTGENIDSEDQTEETEDLTEYHFVSTSDSELEEENSVYHQQCQYSWNWRSQHKMEGLPETQGKGALMFAQRRKRMDEIVSEHEELRSKGLPVEGPAPEPEPTAPPKMYEPNETYVYSAQDNYTEQPVSYQEDSNASKPLVPNRTAKPFLGFQANAPPPARHSVVVPVTPAKKKPEPKFKVPVPVPSNTSPKVWSPTSDVIASRDERISVPAIKTGILPETKRKGSSKQSPPEQKANLQNKGDRRSFIECEEDCFSLGAEACNFMQPKPIKLKNPPPVAPKPTINPACPPWMVKEDPYIPPRNPQPSPAAIGPHSQNYLQPHDRAKPQQMSNQWAQDQTPARLQTSTNMSSQLQPQPTANSWSLEQSRSPVSMQARGPTYSPQAPPPQSSAPNSVASCPSQPEKTHRGQSSSLSGKGVELFAKRQSRMEKFVVDAEPKQVSKPRAPSPTSSLPNSWRYSSNIRAPPPVGYNPLLTPFYPPAAAKQPPSTSPKIKPKQTKPKPKQATKHLNALDIMKHQPYQLDSALFTYEKVPEIKAPSPKPSPTPTKSEPRKVIKHKIGPARSPRSISKSETTKPDVLTVDKQMDVNLSVSPVLNHVSTKQETSNRPASTTSQHSSLSSISDSLAAAFSPASLIARGVRQMAPRPKFSAKKQVAEGKQWKPVAMLH
ncbi:LOW QUALITY PROTEIN: synaptopodin-2 [Boleophthalmus pectinirostris]|uniref:LOW QUALITY PROTEIN: synaptopodin-2 n=1 Tax=Boleophthalmus pectinirostris TaxID=150288 RepID=UPI00242C39BE|nr:LOW QUALITY PROTEIN: synaptopodin-2 [Boleophthalmus pectinirostris]